MHWWEKNANDKVLWPSREINTISASTSNTSANGSYTGSKVVGDFFLAHEAYPLERRKNYIE